jgi:polyisoprenoid-binding protein YceI
VILLLWLTFVMFALGSKTNVPGEQSFNFADKMGRNQATFYSETPIEDINGTASGLSGNAALDVFDFSTVKGKIDITVESFKTGIEMRDGHIQGKKWLDQTQSDLSAGK